MHKQWQNWKLYYYWRSEVHKIDAPAVVLLPGGLFSVWYFMNIRSFGLRNFETDWYNLTHFFICLWIDSCGWASFCWVGMTESGWIKTHKFLLGVKFYVGGFCICSCLTKQTLVSNHFSLKQKVCHSLTTRYFFGRGKYLESVQVSRETQLLARWSFQ